MIYLNFQICISVPLTLHDGGRYHIETSPLICKSNQWTGFYMEGTSVMKELIHCEYCPFNTTLYFLAFKSEKQSFTDVL